MAKCTGCGIELDENGKPYVVVDGTTIVCDEDGLKVNPCNIRTPSYSDTDGFVLLNQTDQYTNADGRVYRSLFCVEVKNDSCQPMVFTNYLFYGIGVLPVGGAAQIRYGVEVSTDGGGSWATLIAHQSDSFTAGWQRKDTYVYPFVTPRPVGFFQQECYRAWLEVLSGTVTWVDSDTSFTVNGIGV